MRDAFRVETVRAAEQALMARLPEGTLMRRAAAGLAAGCAQLLGRVYGARVALLTGSGDNGGDALYAGALLARRGAAVTAVLLNPDRAHPGGLAALRAAGGRVLPAGADGPDGTAVTGAAGRAVGNAHLVIDGIVGIGGRGGLRPAAAALVRRAGAGGAAMVAVDVPSGVDADTGEVTGEAVKADLTVTFGAYKPGLLVNPGRSRAGVLRLVDIGLGPLLTGVPELTAPQHADIAALLPRPGNETTKYRRGVVGVAAGSARYPGAAVLAVAGALRGGAGAVRFSGSAADAVVTRFPETLVSAGPPSAAGRVQAWVVGPGAGDDRDARRIVDDVLDADVPVLVDADGLRLLDARRVRDRRAPTLLTPHAGEAAALLSTDRETVEARRLSSVRELAHRFGATALLKGSTTLIAHPEQPSPVRVNPTGTARLATAGSGDVLSGLTGSLMAAGLDTGAAATVGAYLHGLAARLAPVPVTAGDVAEALPAAWREVIG